MPISAGKGETEKLKSEYATLLFLQELGTVPAPKVHGFAPDRNNVAKTSYILMDKVSGISLFEALDGGMNRECVYETFRGLAKVRKSLAERRFYEIGSLTYTEGRKCGYAIDRQLSIWNFFEFLEKYKSYSGPFESSLGYYANLHNISWSNCRKENPEDESLLERWRIHLYRGSVLSSYVGEETGEFFLALTDLDGQNIIVNPQTGSITGIIDWEFASTLPFRAAEHYPLLLAQKEEFVEHLQDVYDDPLAELIDWRRFYASQFSGDSAMGDYLNNIDAIVAFENILRDNDSATLENLVETCKFLETRETLDQVLIPFPWTGPTTSPKLIIPTMDLSTNGTGDG
jgi:hypothetical protein